ncbi:hypothetical protein BH708_02420 [Brachybacterium sp. P6-10-X1]|uniref:TetR/AcrR family transcriptional regulator n=1 Tax=Brachybacterium sp. P6-10-X1 TaxID=1903186 RepID=UPI000971BF32|nr:TetR/AcrR family transcriptional regulator [Brachybacterium sp. P6-10-X1]APX31762.1 hypothetical protein BH708_02420 [Brachybacterium sp. P6-10-X1]
MTMQAPSPQLLSPNLESESWLRAIPRQPGLAPAEAAPPGHEARTRRERIVDGAAEMFADHGYSGTSLRALSRHVGISHPGLLHHFASKADLLDAVVDRLEAHAQQALERMDEFCCDPGALLEGLARVWDPTFGSLQLLATLDAESVSTQHPARYRMARLRKVHEHVLEHCFSRLADRGWLRDGIDPAFAARAMLALVLTHAVRERTVRPLQGGTHDDSSMTDLQRLAQAFLAHPSTTPAPRHSAG